jgi:hypothetical protein
MQKRKMCEDCGERHMHFGLPGKKQRRWCAQCRHAHPGAVSLSMARCEDCSGSKAAEFGLPSVKNARGHMIKRWCNNCSTAHAGATRPSVQLCDECGVVTKSFGMPGGKPQWCRKCSYGHAGAILVKDRPSRQPNKCVDCGLKRGGFGPADGSQTNVWCVGCAKQSHPGYVATHPNTKKMCVDCGLKMGGFGPADGSQTNVWCVGCAKQSHPGYVATNVKQCEDCGKNKPARFGPTSARARSHRRFVLPLILCIPDSLAY